MMEDDDESDDVIEDVIEVSEPDCVVKAHKTRSEVWKFLSRKIAR